MQSKQHEVIQETKLSEVLRHEFLQIQCMYHGSNTRVCTQSHRIKPSGGTRLALTEWKIISNTY